MRSPINVLNNLFECWNSLIPVIFTVSCLFFYPSWEVLLNRAGTTFKKLPDAQRENLDEAKAIALMTAQPSMIKRPVLDVDGKLVVVKDGRFGPYIEETEPEAAAVVDPETGEVLETAPAEPAPAAKGKRKA